MTKELSWALYVGTYPPRECGIATFTKDLTNVMDKRFNPTLRSKILAINDNGSSIYNYRRKVRFQINETDIEDYIEAAKKINENKTIKIINIQHEFGIFGGEYGDYLIAFLETLKKPVVTTFHSILPKPDEHGKKTVQAIAKRSSAIVVMTNLAVDILVNDYGIKRSKMNVIPHGIPSVSFKNTSVVKESLGFGDKIILSTFGLLSSGKGIEYAIKALPPIVKKYPNILYLILGETHPQVRKEEGEIYRNKLRKLVEKLNLKGHVKFYNKYLTLQEITKFLSATDIYITPSQDKNQICSGTLAYAIGCGKAVIATSSLYAEEVLAEERGILIGFKNSEEISKGIKKLLDNPGLKKKIERKAYEYSRQMTWFNVASNYLDVFKNVIELNEGIGMHKFPRLKLNHLLTLTDDTGIIQHAKLSVTNRKTGYTVDDNARALIIALKYYDKYKDETSLKLINTYLGFLHYAQKKNGKFHNLVSYDRKFLDREGSEDSFGRTIWALGLVISSKLYENIKETAKYMLSDAIKWSDSLESPRAKAFTILGLYFAKTHKNKIKMLANSLVEQFKKSSSYDWKWFEEYLTYSNGILPQALFLAHDILGDKKYLDIAQESLNFLSSLVIVNNKLVLIGHNGWYNQGGRRALYDQQPVDASSMVQVYLTAYKITKKKEYYDKAILAFNWFLGRNSIDQVVYDEVTGGCFDGLLPNCVNLNQGAESTVCYLLARLSLDQVKR